MIKNIEGYDGKYTISDDGVVVSVYRIASIHGKKMKIEKPIILKPGKDKKGYLVVILYDGNGNPKSEKVHRLVANAFIPNPENKRCVCHKDNNPQNNNVNNLYWGTDLENQRQAWNDHLFHSEKPVSQYDMQGNYIRTYKSQNEAGRETNIASANIWKCVHGYRKSAGGYIWRESV